MLANLRGLLLLAPLLGCAGERPPPQPVFAETQRSPRLQFRYDLADGKGALDSEALGGRTTLIAFLTTYDLASQAEARFLSLLSRTHVPRMSGVPSGNLLIVAALCDTF